MIPWESRSVEERSLLNPCFCAMVIWHAAIAYRKETGRLMSFEESFRGFAKETGTRGFPSPSLGGLGFVVCYI